MLILILVGSDYQKSFPAANINSDNLVPRVLSYPPYRARENPGNEVETVKHQTSVKSDVDVPTDCTLPALFCLTNLF